MADGVDAFPLAVLNTSAWKKMRQKTRGSGEACRLACNSRLQVAPCATYEASPVDGLGDGVVGCHQGEDHAENAERVALLRGLVFAETGQGEDEHQACGDVGGVDEVGQHGSALPEHVQHAVGHREPAEDVEIFLILFYFFLKISLILPQ